MNGTLGQEPWTGPQPVDAAWDLAPALSNRKRIDGGELVLRHGYGAANYRVLIGPEGTERKQININDQTFPHARLPTASWTSQVPLYAAQSWTVPPVVTAVPPFGRAVDQHYVPPGEILNLMERQILPEPIEWTAQVPTKSEGGAGMSGYLGQMTFTEQRSLAEQAAQDAGVPPSSPWWQPAVNFGLEAVKALAGAQVAKQQLKLQQEQLKLYASAAAQGLSVPGVPGVPGTAPMLPIAPASPFLSPWLLLPIGAVAAYAIYTAIKK